MCDDSKGNVLSHEEVQSVILEIIKSEGIEDGKLVINAGSRKGDGYMSYMTSVDVLGKNKNLHLILKCSPKNAELRKVAPIQLIFEREIKFYSQIYPEMKKFQEEKKVAKPFKSVAKCYKADSTESNEFLVFENLRKNGFNLWNMKLPMDENHMQLLLKEYAKFHAVSYGMKEQKPEIFAKLVKDHSHLFTPKNFDQHFFDSITICLDKVESIFQGQKEIVDKIKHLKENTIDYLLYIYKDATKFPTIIHGDCWCNNMMFRYGDPANKLYPTEVCLLDFQVCCLASPILDLSYFIYSNSTEESLKKLDSYLDTYHEHLNYHLQALGCESNLVNKEKLKAEWPLFSKYGYIMSLMVVRASLTDPEETVDFTELVEAGRPVSDFFSRDVKNEDIMDKKFADLTRHMYENGFLDFEK